MCKCEPNFTCRQCLSNARPYYFTTSTGAVLPASPLIPAPARRRRAGSQ